MNSGPAKLLAEKVREKSRECHNHKPQPFPDPKRKRKPTNLNKHKPNKRTKSTKISSFFPKRGNRNTERTEKHKNKMAQLCNGGFRQSIYFAGPDGRGPCFPNTEN